MKNIFYIRCAIAGVLLIFSILIFPSWGLNVCALPKLFHSGTFGAAPLLVISGIAFACIFPLGILGMFSSLLPSRILDIACVFGASCCLAIFAHFLMPHSWKIDDKLDSFYQNLWEKDLHDASSGNNYEHIQYDGKDNGKIIFYVKGFGITYGEMFFTLISFLPCAAIVGEKLLRRRMNSIR